MSTTTDSAEFDQTRAIGTAVALPCTMLALPLSLLLPGLLLSCP